MCWMGFLTDQLLSVENGVMDCRPVMSAPKAKFPLPTWRGVGYWMSVLWTL